MTELTTRVITALVLAASVLLALFVLPAPVALLLFGAFLAMGCWEWSGFLRTGRLLRLLYVATGAGLVWLTTVYPGLPVAPQALLAAAVAWWLGFAVWLFRRPIGYGRLLTGCVGFLVLIPAWLALLALLAAPDGRWLFVWLAATVAAADVGAYFTGKARGRRKLAPQISPGKTVEGLLGGLVAAACVAAGGALWLGHNPLPFVFAGPAVAALSVAGDLTVSAFKRNAGLKDAGWVLPGHGGVMDRIDGLVAAAPAFVLLVSGLRILAVG